MDFLSDTTKKEKRNLLAAGFTGTIVAQLKINRTEIDFVGFKLHSEELPVVVVASLCAAIAYLLIKFCSSYLHERCHSDMDALAAQIREGKTGIDIAQAEKEIKESMHLLVEQQRSFLAQQEHEETRLAGIRAKIGQGDSAHDAALKILEAKKNEFAQALGALQSPFGSEHFDRVHIQSLGYSIDQKRIQGELEKLDRSWAEYSRDRQTARQKEVEHLQREQHRSKERQQARAANMALDEEAITAKRLSVSKWRHAQRGATVVTPLHLFLDVYLPILVGLTGLASLGWLAFHLPEPKPITLPFF
ncbi:MAG: hypothetical protein NTX84_05855 [Nitrospirae bacterium]|nr:hypothetical protein [Nitrospirota bacterium]